MRKKKFYFIAEVIVVALAIAVAFSLLFPHFLRVQKFGLLTEKEIASQYGEWVWEGDTATQTDTSLTQTVLLFRHEYDNFEIAVKANAHLGSEGIRIVFAGDMQDSYLLWNIGGYQNTAICVESWRLQNPAPAARTLFNHYVGLHQNRTTHIPYQLQQRQWHDIRLLVNSDTRHVIGYIDGKKMLDEVLNVPTKGRVGVSAYQTKVSYKDITVKPLSDGFE